MITIGSSLFYIGLSAIVLLLSIAAEKTRKWHFPFTIFIILTFVAGFRAYSVGTDTQRYVNSFEYLHMGGTIGEEVGFEFVSKVLMDIYNNPTFLLVVYAAIIYGLIIFRLWELKEEVSFSYSFFTFYSFYFFESMNALRQFIAVAFVVFATRYLLKRNYIKFSVFILFATFFHTSAILGFLCLGSEIFFWQYLTKKQKRFIKILAVFGVIFGSYIMTYMSRTFEKYRHYFLTQNVDMGLRVIALIGIFVMSLFLYNQNERRIEISKTSQSSRYLLYSVRLYYCFACLFGSIGYFYEYMTRIGLYFVVFENMYFGMLAKEKIKSNKIILKIMIGCITIYILYQYIFLVNGSMHHPYFFVWNK